MNPMMVNPMMMNPLAASNLNMAMMMNPLTANMATAQAHPHLPLEDVMGTGDSDAEEVPHSPRRERSAKASASIPVEDQPSNPKHPAHPGSASEYPTSKASSAVAMTITGDSFQDAFNTLQQARDSLYRTTREEMRIPRSIAWIRQIPKVRLSECVEAIHSRLDSTVTSALSQPGMIKLLWLLTRQRPTVPMSSLRIEHYTQLNTKMRSRHEQLIQLPDSDMGETLTCLTNVMELTDHVVTHVAAELGFDEEWLTVKLGKAHSKAKAKAAVEETRNLPSLLSPPTVPKVPPTVRSPGAVAKAGPKPPPGLSKAPAPTVAAAQPPKTPGTPAVSMAAMPAFPKPPALTPPAEARLDKQSIKELAVIFCWTYFHDLVFY